MDKYLFDEGVKLYESIFYYSIHGQNSEITNILEENNAKPSSESYDKCLKESIKCHNNNFVNYFTNKYLQNAKENFFNQSLKYYNFAFFEDKFIGKRSFTNLCKYDYYTLVKIIMIDSDINQTYEIQ